MAAVPSRTESGDIGIGTAWAIAMTLLAAIAMLNVLLFLYGQSAVRAALDEGVRAGSRVDAGPVVCAERAQAAINDLVSGSLGDGIGAPTCAVVGGVLVASVSATFNSQLAGGLSWTINLEARGVQEVPAQLTP